MVNLFLASWVQRLIIRICRPDLEIKSSNICFARYLKNGCSGTLWCLSFSTLRAESYGTSQSNNWQAEIEIKVRVTAVARDLKIGCSRYFWCLSCSTRRAESNGTSQLKIWQANLEIKVRVTAVARDLKIGCSRYFWCLSCSTRRAESNGTSQLKIWQANLEIKVRVTAVARDLKIGCSRYFWCLSWSTRQAESNKANRDKIWHSVPEIWSNMCSSKTSSSRCSKMSRKVFAHFLRTSSTDQSSSNAKDRDKICRAVLEISLHPNGDTKFARSRRGARKASHIQFRFAQSEYSPLTRCGGNRRWVARCARHSSVGSLASSVAVCW